MNERLVEEIANAVLYEGYILYPYRASALKNRQRFNFGVVAPMTDDAASASGEKSLLQTQCLVCAGPESRLSVRVRFLQVVARSVGRMTASQISSVDEIEVDGRVYRGWQEAVEREILLAGSLRELADRDLRQRFYWPGEEEAEPLRSPDGSIVGAIVRRRESVCGELALSAEPIEAQLFKITLRVSNLTPPAEAKDVGRDGWLMRALVSTHAILRIEGGEWLSLVDPPDDAREHAGSCQQVGLWPVLVGGLFDRDALLASPIILYDHPQIAPESVGDFCDGTEIDEMLALRIMTMTEAEKLEMRQGDERGRLMLERTERLSEEQMIRLHGVLRGLRTIDSEGAR
jgi:hypothetical protein